MGRDHRGHHDAVWPFRHPLGLMKGQYLEGLPSRSGPADSGPGKEEKKNLTRKRIEEPLTCHGELVFPSAQIARDNNGISIRGWLPSRSLSGPFGVTLQRPRQTGLQVTASPGPDVDREHP
jgi:hypothetical protein